MDKKVALQLNSKRKVTGVLRGFDPFMNIVLDDAVEERSGDNPISMGLAVTFCVNIIVTYSVDDSWKQYLDDGSLGTDFLDSSYII